MQIATSEIKNKIQCHSKELARVKVDCFKIDGPAIQMAFHVSLLNRADHADSRASYSQCSCNRLLQAFCLN